MFVRPSNLALMTRPIVLCAFLILASCAAIQESGSSTAPCPPGTVNAATPADGAFIAIPVIGWIAGGVAYGVDYLGGAAHRCSTQ
jgi:hypothetical protein